MIPQDRVVLVFTPQHSYRLVVTGRTLSGTLIKCQWLDEGGLRTLRGSSTCHPDDNPEWRLGVAVALRRVTQKIRFSTSAWRRSFRRAFYQAWPEAHPEYRVEKGWAAVPKAGGWDFAAKDGDMVNEPPIPPAEYTVHPGRPLLGVKYHHSVRTRCLACPTAAHIHMSAEGAMVSSHSAVVTCSECASARS